MGKGPALPYNSSGVGMGVPCASPSIFAKVPSPLPMIVESTHFTVETDALFDSR